MIIDYQSHRLSWGVGGGWFDPSRDRLLLCGWLNRWHDKVVVTDANVNSAKWSRFTSNGASIERTLHIDVIIKTN